MCERYSFALPKDKTTRRYGVKVTIPLEAHYNISPGLPVPIIRNTFPAILMAATWGLTGPPGKFGRIKTISSISADEIAIPEHLLALLLTQRCLVPADGFYLWQQVSKRSRVPFRVTLKWNLPFAFAGVWQQETDEAGAERITCAILTTAGSELLLPYGDRMPVILPLEEEKNWLLHQGDAEAWRHVLKPFPSGRMKIFPVSPRLNQKDLNSPSLIEPVRPADQFGNYMLFE